MNTNISEVARLRQEIEINYYSAQLGLHGLAAGVSYHRFITARMERMQQCHEQLEQLIGQEAHALMVHTLDALPQPTRETITRVIRHELGPGHDTDQLLDQIRHLWHLIDLLRQQLGTETAYRIIHSLPAVSPVPLHI